MHKVLPLVVLVVSVVTSTVGRDFTRTTARALYEREYALGMLTVPVQLEQVVRDSDGHWT